MPILESSSRAEPLARNVEFIFDIILKASENVPILWDAWPPNHEGLVYCRGLSSYAVIHGEYPSNIFNENFRAKTYLGLRVAIYGWSTCIPLRAELFFSLVPVVFNIQIYFSIGTFEVSQRSHSTIGCHHRPIIK
jgi:hypothetical protein